MRILHPADQGSATRNRWPGGPDQADEKRICAVFKKSGFLCFVLYILSSLLFTCICSANTNAVITQPHSGSFQTFVVVAIIGVERIKKIGLGDDDGCGVEG